MAEDRYQHTQDGQEVQEEDFNLFAKEAALADDRVLAELLRMPMLGGSVAKGIIPYTVGDAPATVAPNGATGSVKIRPFRPVIGARQTVAAAAAAGDPASNAWRDVRSAVYAMSDDSVTMQHAQAFAANATGNARWDLVYVRVQTDLNGGTKFRYLRPPGGGLSTISVVTTLVQALTIGVVAGTAAASPVPPALPADSAGSYYIALAAVRIPNGFGGTSTVLPTDIWDLAPTLSISSALGVSALAPANTCAAGNTAGTTWGSSGTRPIHQLQASMVGGASLIIALDLTSGTPSAWSHLNGGIIDSSRDWRKRLFRWSMSMFGGGPGRLFAWNRTTGAGCPRQGSLGANPYGSRSYGLGQSFTTDNFVGTGGTKQSVAYVDTGLVEDLGASSAVEIQCDPATGNLVLAVSGTPSSVLFFWIDATAQYPNL